MKNAGSDEIAFAGAGETRLVGTRSGSGDLGSVLLMHGLTAHRRLVLMGSRILEKSGLATFSFDARGHGESSPPAGSSDWTYGELCIDAAAGAAAAGFERPIVAGVSMGAHTAAALALTGRLECSGLVLLTPAFDPDAEVDLDRWSTLADALQSDGIEGFARCLAAELPDGHWRETVAAAALQRMEVHSDLDAVVDALRSIPRSRPFESWGDLEAIDCPTVVIGSLDEADPLHPLATARRWAEAIPDATLVVESEGESPLAWRGAAIGAEIRRLAESVASG